MGAGKDVATVQPSSDVYKWAKMQGTGERLRKATGSIMSTALLTRPFQEDVRSRFVDLDGTNERFPTVVTTAVIGFVASVAEFRNLARF